MEQPPPEQPPSVVGAKPTFNQWLRDSPWWHKLLVLFPLLLVPIGGLLGALAGAGAAAANAAVLRSQMADSTKVGICVLISLGAAIAYVVLAAIVLVAIHPQG